MKVSDKCFDLVREFEGCKLAAYLCPAGVWTIGYGHTGPDVYEGQKITKLQAEKWLKQDLNKFSKGVFDACTQVPTQHQLDAMASFAFNVGVPGLRTSSVMRAHNAGDSLAASRAFGLWNKARNPKTGKLEVLKGLTRRRAAESALYLLPSDDEVPEDMPQIVEPEKPMVESTINRGAALAGGTATVATVAQTVQTVGEIKDGVDNLGSWLLPVLLVVAVVACGYIVYERLRQRKSGWA